MKLESFKFQDGKVFWLPNYPSKELSLYQFLELEAKSLASAIEVAPEDRESIRLKVWSKYPDAVLLETGKVYSAECEMEIKYSWNVEHQNLSSVEKIIGTPKVARLKPKDEIFPAANSHSRKENSAHGYTEGSDINLPEKRESEGQEKLLDSLLEEILPAIFNFAKNSDNESYDKALRKALTKFSITRRK